jgi:dihydrofolate reductase
MVVAYGENRGIGFQGRLPWRLPSDMRRFRELTIGGTVLMGRKTYQSLPDAYRPLPGRRNVVVSATAGFDPGAVDATAGAVDAAAGAVDAETGVDASADAAAGTGRGGAGDTSVELHTSIAAALDACGEDCFVIGGGSVYEQTLALVERVYATVVHASPLSDTYFPDLPPREWRRSERSDDLRENGTRFHFATYDRLR